MCCSCRHQHLHRKAINVVRNLLASHDVDPRYQNRDVKARIAKLYVPLIDIVIDALPQLCIESRPTMQQQSTGTKHDDARGIDQTVAMAIAGSSIYNIPGESSATVMYCDVIMLLCLHLEYIHSLSNTVIICSLCTAS